MPETSVPPFFQHPSALVESSAVGQGTRVAAFAHILPGARIGCRCSIGSHAVIADGAVLGDRVTVQSGVYLPEGACLEDDVVLGPNATFIGDPRRGRPTLVKRGASIGANATIHCGVTIEEDAAVAPGAVVAQDVPRRAIVDGNPARIVGYTAAGPAEPAPSAPVEAPASRVDGVVLRRLPLVADLRGPLSFGEVGREVPFPVKRYFLVFDVATEHVRGEHAHRTLRQFLVCVHGRCCVSADDGLHRQEFLLDSPNLGLYIPPMTWAAQYKYSPDAVLLALVSEPYDPADYIRDYAEFLALRRL